MRKRAILSVHDKTGLVDLGRALAEAGWELAASGGTATALNVAGLPVREVADITGAPEMLGGRVKTLHPAIHGGILARDTTSDLADLAGRGIEPFGLVVCNLYPFAATVAKPGIELEEALEQIDIGGVTLLRAAAKNFAHVTVLCDPSDYSIVIESLHNGGPDVSARRALALKAFRMTADYDAAIAEFLERTASRPPSEEPLPQTLAIRSTRAQTLRYGENPHQAAALYTSPANAGPLGGTLRQGKELSYNNLLDLDAAWRAVESFIRPAVVIVKHLSPCGMATAERAAAAFPPALASDPVSAFGGVVAVNRPVDHEFVAALEAADLFIEAVIAPDFTDDAAAWFAARKKNCRLVSLGESIYDRLPMVELRSIRGGIVAQTRDEGDPAGATWKIASRRAPTESEVSALHFAWIACQHVKSNAIVLARETATIGIGGGLPSRVDAVHLAVAKAGERARGAVMASDAFFPFADGVEAAVAAGVTAVIEPGGSIRDEEVVAAADKHDLALVFTGTRHFRH